MTSIKDQMKAAGVTDNVLSAVTGIPATTIATYRRGTSKPSIANAALLEVSLNGSPAARARIEEAQAQNETNKQNGATKGGRKSELFERYFNGLEVRDASVPLRFSVMPEDLVGAVRKEPGRCYLRNSCHRSFGSDTVLFFKTLAYVELVEEDGTRVVERYILSKPAAGIVEAFDKGEEVPTDGRLVTLSPPTPGKTLEHGRKAKRARLKGEYKAPIYRERAAKAAATRASKPPIDVRSGTGQFPMVAA